MSSEHLVCAGTMLGTGNTAVTKRDKVPTLKEWAFWGGGQSQTRSKTLYLVRGTTEKNAVRKWGGEKY